MGSSKHIPVLFPTHLNTFAQCPERYFLEHRNRRRAPREFSPQLAKGIAVHAILSHAAQQYRQLNGVPANLRQLAEHELPRAPYISDEAWQAEVLEVERLVKAGLPYLDGTAQVIATEATLHFPYHARSESPSFVLAAKVDLLLLKADEHGDAYLDVVDYKTSATVRTDRFQELAARIVVKHSANQRFGIADAAIVNTTIFLGAEVTQSRTISDDECREVWQQIKHISAAILNGDSFPPNPSALCQWCPFFTNGCSAHASPAASNTVSEWLDSVAG